MDRICGLHQLGFPATNKMFDVEMGKVVDLPHLLQGLRKQRLVV